MHFAHLGLQYARIIELEKMKLLLIDDEPSLRRTLRVTLESMSHVVSDVAGSEQAYRALEEDHFDLVFLDLRLDRESGLDAIPKLRESSPNAAIVVMTAYAAIDTAVEAIRRGAFDYLAKPFTPDQIRVVLNRWNVVRGLQTRVLDLQEQVRTHSAEIDLRTAEPFMQNVFDVAFRVAATDATILLRGETGTGKGVLARAIHERSCRSERPFITIHCPSLSAELLESDLFGHTRGAFTGAIRDVEGKVAAADGGTLFFDEIGDLPFALQPKLLRFLQDKCYERIGETRTRRSDVRILAATNRQLEKEVAEGRFREDLLYRLNVIEIKMLPLRERRKDILTVAEHLREIFAYQNAKRIDRFTPEARAALERYHWPGNLRELRNAVERGSILTSDNEIGLAHLPVQVGHPQDQQLEVGGAATLEQLEAEHIRRILTSAPSLDEAAVILGIDPSTLYRKRKRYGL